ncbi:MAG: hypothetical protein CMJ58_09700 [Planctomycetaceae bacterium]|nr:hypothetical protein [Planctomycetaceae bacterium]
MRPKVLFVDDDRRLLMGMARSLRREPFELLTACDADEAQQIVKRWAISLIVTDEHMPGRRGTELLAWMAQACPEAPRIVLTGSWDPETAVRAVNEGAVYRYFSKPVDLRKLAAAIRSGLQHRAELASRV